jgi:hypothetical protein
MRSRYQSLQSDINRFLNHHPERLRRQNSYIAGPLGVLSVDKVVDYPLGIAVGKIGILTIRSILKHDVVVDHERAAFVHDIERSRQIWVPYGVSHRGVHILATNQRLIEDGFAQAQTILKKNLPSEGSELDLREEVTDMLVDIGATAAEDEVSLLYELHGEVKLA